ncbi:MAG: tetratricopeptide repeat protein, partial [Candidatus Brocadiales bacterium]|nr:tetratricopeptide repeat protein [Candidatus Bathyanammoxibius sp.]
SLAETYMNKGVKYEQEGRLDEAIFNLQEALAINQGLVEAHMLLGRIYQEKGMMQEAISEYQQIISLNPEYADAHKEFAEALKTVGLYSMAERETEIYKNLTRSRNVK